jgi:heme exporter protein D
MGERFHWVANTAVAIFFVLGLFLSDRHPWIFYMWMAGFLTFVAALLVSYFLQSVWQRKASRSGQADTTERP